jgi:hypothetical protein
MEEDTQTRQFTGRPAFEEVWAALLVTDKNLREAAGKMRETEQRVRNIVNDLERKFGKTSRKIDDMFVPRLERQFGAMGFVFDRSAERAVFGNREFPSCYAEIDVFLENGDRAVAVAVKPWLCIAGKTGEGTGDPMGPIEANTGDIREHIERMEKLRRWFNVNNDRRKLYGAVAAAVFPANVLGFALERGFYVIDYAEDRAGVREPEGGAREW